MKTTIRNFGRTRCGLGAAALLMLTLAGCLEKRLVWAPDGSRAAVIASDGLQICDAEGKFLGAPVAGIYAAAWCGDSQRLVLARGRDVKDWATVARIVGSDRAAAIERQAGEMAKSVEAGAPWSVVAIDLGEKKATLKICLRERYGAQLRPKLSADEWKELAEKSVEVTEVIIARAEGATVAVGVTLHEALGRVLDLRPAPGRELVAFTIEGKPESDKAQLLIAGLDGQARPTVVAKNAAAYPDWTADGRSIVYCESGGSDREDILSLGVVAKRDVLADGAGIKLTEKPAYLAAAMFSGTIRVRCLRDGRVLFNTGEFNLPMAAEDYGDPQEQLFAVDTARQPTLVRMIPRKQEENLPQSLAFFEVSPDEKQVVFGSFKGQVSLLTLATGEVAEIQAGTKVDLQGAPVWRAAGELTYVRRGVAKAGAKPPRKAEFVLRRGEKETVLSQSWPDEMLAALVGGDSK